MELIKNLTNLQWNSLNLFFRIFIRHRYFIMTTKNQTSNPFFKNITVSNSNHSERFSQIKVLTGRLKSIKQISLNKFKKIARNSGSLTDSFRSQINQKQKNNLTKGQSKCSIGTQKNKQIDCQAKSKDKNKTLLVKQGKVLFQNLSQQKLSHNQSFRSNNKINQLKETLRSSKNIIKQKFTKVKRASTSLWNLQSNKSLSVFEDQKQTKSKPKKLLEKQIYQFEKLSFEIKQILQNTQKEKAKLKTLKELIELIGKQKLQQIKNSSQKILASTCFPTQIQENLLNFDQFSPKNTWINQTSNKKLRKLKQFQIQSLQKQIHLIIKATNQNLARLKISKEQILAFRKQRVMFSCFNRNIQKQIKKQEVQYMKLVIENKNKLNTYDNILIEKDFVEKVNAIFKKHNKIQKEPVDANLIEQQRDLKDYQLQNQNEDGGSNNNSCLSFYAESKKKVMISLRNKNKQKIQYCKKTVKQNIEYLKNKIQYFENIIHKLYNHFGIQHICQQQQEPQPKFKKDDSILDQLKKQACIHNQQQSTNKGFSLINQKYHFNNIEKVRGKIINLATKNNLISDKIKKYDDLIYQYQQNIQEQSQGQIKLRQKWVYEDQLDQENCLKQKKERELNQNKQILTTIMQMLKLLGQNQKQNINTAHFSYNQLLTKISFAQQYYCNAKIKKESQASLQKLKKITKQKSFRSCLKTPQSEYEIKDIKVRQNCSEHDDLSQEQKANSKSNKNFVFCQKKNQKLKKNNNPFNLQSTYRIQKRDSFNKDRSSLQGKHYQLIENLPIYQNSDKAMNRKQFQKEYFREIQKNEKKKKTALIKKPLFSIF